MDKGLEKILVKDKFRVDEVISESQRTSYTPMSERVLGGPSPHYKTGFTTGLTLKVTPEDKSCPVNTLKFAGYSIVKAGDNIEALIPRAKVQTIPTPSPNRTHSSYRRGMKEIYTPREYNNIENAIEIIITSDGKNLRTDRSVEYSDYII